LQALALTHAADVRHHHLLLGMLHILMLHHVWHPSLLLPLLLLLLLSVAYAPPELPLQHHPLLL
jgi:hypothetical protein